jgi:DNA ligase (NAD+)
MNIDVINSATIKELDELIKTAEYNYIYEEKQIYTDTEYDYMLERYSYLTGTNRVSNASISKDCTMAKLPAWMPSLSKALHGSNALELWAKKVPCDNYMVSMKLDGCSALYSGAENKLYSRGTYSEGQDITMMLPFLNLPRVAFMVRGELIVQDSIFKEKYSMHYVNARAMVAGIIRSFNIASNKASEMHKAIAADIKFIAYEIITGDEFEMKPEKQLAILEDNGYSVVRNKIIHIIANDILSGIHSEFLDSDFAFDGLVIMYNKKYVRCTNERPKYAIAYKKELENLIGFSEVVSVSWNISKCGYIKPIVNIVPITINSVLISKTTGINARFINNNVIGPGAKVKIIRSGDVIPNIAEVLTPSTSGIPDMPTHIKYVWNETMVDIVSAHHDDKEIIMQQINFFLKTLKIKGIDNKYIARIYNPKINSILAFIQMTQEDIAGLGDVISKKIITNIQNGVANATEPELMTASGIFGRGLGIKRINDIFAHCPDIIKNGHTYDVIILRSIIAPISGFGKVLTDLFIEAFPKYLEWHDALHLSHNAVVAPLPLSHYLSKKVVSITGTRDPTILAFLDQIGAHVKPLSSKTQFLIVKNYELKNSKTAQVIEKGFKCRIIDITDFTKEFILITATVPH